MTPMPLSFATMAMRQHRTAAHYAAAHTARRLSREATNGPELIPPENPAAKRAADPLRHASASRAR